MITDNDTFRSYPSKIEEIFNNWPKVEGEGNNLSLTPVRKGKMILEPTGNTSQNGTPTPDAPVEVKNATGEQVVKVVGKNLLNVTDVASTTTNGITYYRENQTYYLSGTNTKTDRVWVLPNNIITNLPQFEVGKNYTLKITGTLPSNVYVQVNAKNQSNGNYSLWSQISDTNAHTITIGSEYVSTAQVFIGIRQTATNVTGNFKIQIEEGSTATEYEAYKEQSYTINLGNIELCKIVDYKDRIYYNNGKWYLEKKIGKYTFTGNENWNVQATDNNFTTFQRYDILPSTAKATNFQQGLCKSNYFKTAITWNIWTNTNVGIDAYVNRILITIPSSIATTKAQLNQWLQEHNVYLDYVLDTPTTTEITEENYPTLYEQLNSLLNAKSYNGITNIIITGDTPVNIKAAALMKGGN